MDGHALFKAGVKLLIGAVLLGLALTITYGGNLVPQNTQEAIMDLVVMLMFLTGYVLTAVGQAMGGGHVKSRGSEESEG